MSAAQINAKVAEPLSITIDMDLAEELKKLKQIQLEQAERMSISSSSPTCSTSSSQSREEKMEADCRSVFVQHVDFGATPSVVERHFAKCGEVERVTVPTDKFSHRPKGYAFVEFKTKEGAIKAMAMSGTTMSRRQIVVSQKRTNEPGMALRGVARGGVRGGARGGAYNNPVVHKYVYVSRAGAGPAQRGAFRPRGRYSYAPY